MTTQLHTQEPHIITDNLDELLAVLPDELSRVITADERARLIEIVLDLGRQPEARFLDGYKYLRQAVVTSEELAYVEARLGAFGDDNRAGIPATLHRISAIRNRRGAIVGLTLRIGRAVSGIVDILRDLIAGGQSVLLMGRPGLGKTTLLREMARVMADEEGKRVVIVDTSNEIAGDGDVPHPAIGRARRMQVARVAQQHDVMIEAVENHMPEVIVIDEIGRIEEALAARTIAERGVQLIATVHGNTLDNLLVNPSMSDLIGGIGAVTLSDEEARRRGTQKTVLERKAPPTFDVVIEMIERDHIAVRRPVAEVVDALLRGQGAPPEIRRRDENGDIQIERAAPIAALPFQPERPARDGREHSGRREHDGRRDRFETRFAGRERGHREREPREPREREPRDQERRERTRGDNGTQSTSSIERDDLEPPQRSLKLLDRDEEDRDVESGDAEEEVTGGDWTQATLDAGRVRRVYPLGVSRSRLSRAVKQLGLNLTLTRSWQEADAVLALTGSGGVPEGSSLLREARELKLPIVGVRGNTYAQILSRMNDLFGGAAREGGTSPRDLAMQEARNAVQRVMAGAEPVELRPQGKTLRRVQHQVAERYHLRSYSVGREPNRRVRFLPNVRG